MRKTEFAVGEFYHIFNRGVDKRNLFQDGEDFERFFKSMTEFNTIDPIGSIYEKDQERTKFGKFGSRASKLLDRVVDTKLVDFVAYCINPNHYHFLLMQKIDKGVEKFMHRFGTGYTKFFNIKHERSGALFQGKFKASHAHTNEYLLHLSAYVNLNYLVHGLSAENIFVRSSFGEYKVGTEGFCSKAIILGQYGDSKQYSEFAQNSVALTQARRRSDKEFSKALLE